MSLQYILDAPEHRVHNSSKLNSYGSSQNILSIPTRSNTPEHEKFNNYDNYSDKDTAMDSLVPSTRTLSSTSSSMTSVDSMDSSSFEIEYFVPLSFF